MEKQESRGCGDCGLCCKLCGVGMMNKPVLKWCEKWEKGKGCLIYTDRPSECADFDCLWLRGFLPESLYPFKVKVVATVQKTKVGDCTIILREDVPGAALKHFPAMIDKWISNGLPIVVIYKERETLLQGVRKDK